MRAIDRENNDKKIISFLEHIIRFHNDMIKKSNDPLYQSSLDLFWDYFAKFENPYDVRHVLNWYINKNRDKYKYSSMIYIKKKLLRNKQISFSNPL